MDMMEMILDTSEKANTQVQGHFLQSFALDSVLPMKLKLHWTSPVDLNLSFLYQIDHEAEIPDAWRGIAQKADIPLLIFLLFIGGIPGAVLYYLFADWLISVLVLLSPAILVFFINLFFRAQIYPGGESIINRLCRGRLDNFPFALFHHDAGIGGKPGPKEEEIELHQLAPLANMLIIVSIFKSANRNFSEFDAELCIEMPDQKIQIPISSSVSGDHCIVAHLENEQSGQLVIRGINHNQAKKPVLNEFLVHVLPQYLDDEEEAEG